MLLHRATVARDISTSWAFACRPGAIFTERDEASAQTVMIVNETFARHFFGDSPAVGRTVHTGGGLLTIVGEVKDSKYDSPMELAAAVFLCAVPAMVCSWVEFLRDD